MAAVLRQRRSPAAITLADLIACKPAGESIRLAAPRVRVLSAGGHLSPFKGRGVEFDESRPYEPGDDLRTIDWRVTARTGKPYTKIFREERNRPVIVWLDLRKPMMFATRGAFKAVVAAETAALVAWSAVANGDRLGGLVFSEIEHRELRPKLGRRAALRLLQHIVDSPAWHSNGPAVESEADTDRALLRLTRVARPGSLIFLISDFRNRGPDCERYLRQLAGHCDLFLFNVYDPFEAELPPPGRYRIQTGDGAIVIETGDERVREHYRERFAARQAAIHALGRYPGVKVTDCRTSEDPRAVLGKSFRS